jgi:hypothetical protein
MTNLDNAYERVVGDTESPIEDTLVADGDAIDISGFQQVAFHLVKPDDTEVTATDSDPGVTVEDSPTGQVKYDFQSGDLDQEGRYRYEWEVTFGDGGVLTVPSDGWETIYVRDELA